MTTPRRNQVDLHTHTSRSDGVLEPVELYRQMRDWGSSLVAITDHDTLAGARELLAASSGSSASGGPGDGASGKPGAGPAIIVGVEINTSTDDVGAALMAGLDDRDGAGELHILGLGVDPADDAFGRLLEEQREARRTRLELGLQRLDEMGLAVRDHLPDVPGGIDAMGRPHLARALVAAGHAESVDDAFGRYLEPGGPAYVPRHGVGTRRAIEAILAASGIAVLAHAAWLMAQPRVADLLCDWGLGGLEVYYAGWPDTLVDEMAELARERGLLATGGSDYHGDRGDYATAQALTRVPDEVGERLLEALASP